MAPAIGGFPTVSLLLLVLQTCQGGGETFLYNAELCCKFLGTQDSSFLCRSFSELLYPRWSFLSWTGCSGRAWLGVGYYETPARRTQPTDHQAAAGNLN